VSINFAAGYLVGNAYRGNVREAEAVVQGSELAHSGPLWSRFEALATRKLTHPVSVRFTLDENGKISPVRTLIMNIAKNKDRAALARELAIRLAQAKDDRTKPGLFIVAVHTGETGTSVHLWHFPNGDTFAAKIDGGRMKVDVLNNAFGAEHSLFKSAAFASRPTARTGYEKGTVEDRQAKLPASAASAYWIYRFLGARLAVNAAEGTETVVAAFNSLFKRVGKDIDLGTQLAHGAAALANRSNETLSFADIARHNVPQELRDGFLKVVGKQYDPNQVFTLDRALLSAGLQYRVTTLRTGVSLIAPLATYDDLVQTTKSNGGRVRLTTEGTVLKQRVRRSGRKQELRSGRRAG
jgi:hypothetical protein